MEGAEVRALRHELQGAQEEIERLRGELSLWPAPDTPESTVVLEMSTLSIDS
jgi:hypothetical protein